METKALTDWSALEAEGAFRSTFSRFTDAAGRPLVDKDGDVTLAMAFTDGAHVEMTWGHDLNRPIGDGVIRVHPDRAEYEGRFWLDTEDGLQSYRKVKNRGARQEWSYTYEPLEADPGEFAGQPVRFLKRLDVWEVSPVFRGAGVRTRTEAIKADDPEGKPLEGTHSCRLREPSAFQAGSFRTMSRRHEGKPYGVIVGRLKGETVMSEQAYRYATDDGWSESQARAHCSAHDGILFEPAKDLIDDRLARAASVLAELKEGRVLSSANRARIAERLGRIKTEIDDLEALLRETEPTAGEDGKRLFLEVQRTLARLNGVAV